VDDLQGHVDGVASNINSFVMKGLVYVPQEMDDELQRLLLLSSRDRFILQPRSLYDVKSVSLALKLNVKL
jgi:hypothetical protein